MVTIRPQGILSAVGPLAAATSFGRLSLSERGVTAKRFGSAAS